MSKPVQPHDELKLSHYWSLLLEQFDHIALLLDQQMFIQHANLAWQAFQPFDSFDQHARLSAWLYPEDRLKFQDALLKQTAQKLYVRMLHAQKGLTWLALQLQPLFNADRHCIGWCILGYEETIQVRQQEYDHAKQRSLNQLLLRLPVMLYRSRNDRYWTMDYVSEGCQTLTGYPVEAFINTPLYGGLIYPEDQPRVWQHIQTALTYHQSFYLQYRIIGRDQCVPEVQERGQGLYSSSGMVLGVEGAVFI